MQVDTYEVLVPALPQPTRYSISYETTQVVEIDEYPVELKRLK